MSFFSQFPKIEYDYTGQGSYLKVADLFRSARPQGNFIDNPTLYKKYNVLNGDRPDVVSYKLYGTSQYYWTFFVINDFLHDGIAAWPMSQEDLSEYLANNYSGQVIETRPTIVRNSDGLVTDYRDSLSGRFNIGETLNASTSSASGTLVRKDADLSQLVIRDITGGTFKGDYLSQVTEFITGATSGDQVASYQVYDYAEAPAWWYKIGDKTQTPVSIDTVIPGGEPRHTCEYVSNRQSIVDENDRKSQIRVLDPKYVEQFAEEFEAVING